MEETLVERFQPYFKHPDPDHYVLKIGDRAVACKNIKRALAWLGVARDFGDDPELFDQELSEAVQAFQDHTRHRNSDGRVGPGTRAQLVTTLLERFGTLRFADLDGSDVIRIPTVFLSYAWRDSQRVDKLDQWLRDHGVRVIRDIDSFSAGSNIKVNIRKSILSADKVLAIHSKQSRNRDWPAFEHQIAEEIESLVKSPVLIYLRLDNTPLKAPDPHRIALEARGKPLKQVGSEILRALDVPVQRARYDYNEDDPL
jgi:TIR domain